jgi:hypothetical protein
MITLQEKPEEYGPSSALLERALEVKKKFPECFIAWNPESKITTREDVELVVQELRDWGNHEGWRAAQELHKCL